MQIMAEKGLVRRDEKQRAHVYEAARPREWTQRQLAGDLMERAFSGSAKALMVGALSARKATKEELAELRKLLDEYREGGEMRLLETWVQTPLAAGASVGRCFIPCGRERSSRLALAAALVAMRSSRARYAAACVAMLVMLARVRPHLGSRDAGRRARPAHRQELPAFPAWSVAANMDAAASFGSGLCRRRAVACAVLDCGRLDFLSRARGRLDIGVPAAPAGRVLCARALAGGTRAPERAGCVCRGRSCCWNPAWRMCPW